MRRMDRERGRGRLPAHWYYFLAIPQPRLASMRAHPRLQSPTVRPRVFRAAMRLGIHPRDLTVRAAVALAIAEGIE